MNLRKIKFFIIVFFILGILNIPYFSDADDMQIQVQSEEINAETIPSNPQPYDDVTINLSSYATDLNRAIIIWQSSSGTVLSGIGKTSYSFKAGGADSSTVFNINITPVGSMSSISKSVVITPSEVEIMWESVDGYTPPFYKGKSLPTAGSLIKVVAIPNTSAVKSGSGSVSYTWKNGDTAVLDASGYNKNSYIFKNSMFDDKSSVSVTAQSVDGSYQAVNTINIPIFTPKLIYYEKSPAEGIYYNNALSTETTLTGDEFTLVAEPYFISLKGHENNFDYTWKINGDLIDTPSKKTELTVRPTSRGGYATIYLLMENASELFQKVSSQLKINI